MKRKIANPKREISGFESYALSEVEMRNVRGGDGGPTTEIWIPDEGDDRTN